LDTRIPQDLAPVSDRLLLAMYLLHLLVPGLLLLDVLTSLTPVRNLGGDAMVGVLAALWLVGGLGLLLLRNRRAFLQHVAPLLVTFYSVVLMSLIAEGLLGFLGITASIRGASGQPYTKTITAMDPAITPGVSGKKTFTINRLGLRGPMPPSPGSAYRILAIGGSTTICANLDDSEEWTHLTMQQLNAQQKNQPVWVGNAGSAGRNTVHHLVLMQWFPATLKVDMVVFLIGVNDLTATTAFEGGPTQEMMEQDAGYEGELPPGTHWRSVYPRYRRLKLSQLIRMAAFNLRQRIRGAGPMPLVDLPTYRKLRAAGPVVPLPDLTTGIKEYRNRIIALAGRCRDLQLRCLFLTQPSMWRSDQSPRELSLFWTGYTGRIEHPKGFISAADLARGMDLYNRTLLDTCQASGLECYDLAASIPKDTSAFFDEMHFNEAGAQLVARHLTQYILSRPPFGHL
jgi:lysophospholipase L1-like esterase